MTRYGRQLRALLWKELLIELRGREALSAGLIFALLVLVTFSFALDLRGLESTLLVPGILWVTITFAGTLSLGRGFARERDRNTLEGLLLAPVDRSALYLAKLAVVAAAMVVVEIAAVPVCLAFFGPALRPDWPRLILVLGLGTLGFAAVGTLFAAVAAQTRAHEVMLPVLLFPIQVPLLLAAVKTTASALAQTPDTGAEDGPWFGLLLAFDGLFLALSVLLFDYAMESD